MAPFDNYILFFPLGIKNSSLQNLLHSNNNFRLRLYGYAGLTRTGFQPGFDQSIYYR